MLEHAKDSELRMAGSLITILPAIVEYFAFQRYYIKGFMLGVVKE